MKIIRNTVCHLLVCTLAVVSGGLSDMAAAHDTWVETNSALVRAGDYALVDLKLGNHGNHHRDFKLASKIDLDGSTLDVVFPDGRTFDLRDQLRDLGYAPSEGYWSARFVPMAAGTYTVSHQLDKVVNHGHPVRAVKSGKCHFLASTTLDRVNDRSETWKQPLGHPLEIVLQSHPVLLCGPGMPVKVKVLFKGKPLSDARVSFVPQGATLAKGFDETYERKTDDQGFAQLTPREGNRFLIVTHHESPEEKTDAYDSTLYSATLSILVPQLCPCCQ